MKVDAKVTLTQLEKEAYQEPLDHPESAVKLATSAHQVHQVRLEKEVFQGLEDYQALMVHQDPKEFKASVVRLGHSDKKELREKQAKSGRKDFRV